MGDSCESDQRSCRGPKLIGFGRKYAFRFDSTVRSPTTPGYALNQLLSIRPTRNLSFRTGVSDHAKTYLFDLRADPEVTGQWRKGANPDSAMPTVDLELSPRRRHHGLLDSFPVSPPVTAR
jgi:hypothetical protein